MGGSQQLLDFLGRQFAIGPGRQVLFEPQVADGDPTKLLNFVADARQHTPNLSIPTFSKDDFQFGRLGISPLDSNRLGFRHAFGQMDAPLEFPQFSRRRMTGDTNPIGLFDSVPRVSQRVGEVAVVGQENEPRTGSVEAADGEESFAARYEVDHTAASLRVPVRANHADRLVDRVIPSALGGPQRFPVDANRVAKGIDFHTLFGHDAAVDLDTALIDENLASSTASQAGRSEDFLEPDGRPGRGWGGVVHQPADPWV